MKFLIHIFLIFAFSGSVLAGNPDRGVNDLRVIAGKVTDADGETLMGAKITISETGETFFADMDGNFKFSIKTDKEYSISVSTIGHQPLILKSGSLTAFSQISVQPL